MLASLGEILGFAGVAVVLLLFGALVVRSLRIARAHRLQPYVALLVVGLVTSLAAQALLIVGGLLGLLPLSGVVTPFLSLGRSSMVSNLAVVGLLLAASRQAPPSREAVPAPGVAPRAGRRAALLAIAAGRAFMVQVWSRGEIMTRQTRTRQADGAVRPQDNPRLREVARLSGAAPSSIGAACPSRWTPRCDVSAHAKEYAALGVSPCGTTRAPRRRPARRRTRPPRRPTSAAIRSAAAPSTCSAMRSPRRTGRAPNSAFVERDVRHAPARLRGRLGAAGVVGSPARARIHPRASAPS